MRWATLLVVIALAGACEDLRDYRGDWQGGRVGDAAPLRVGAGDSAALAIDRIDAHGLAGRLAVDGGAEIAITSVPGAEADALASLSFAGDPVRVYLAFAGDTLAVIALRDDDRVELRLLRGGTDPLYAIYVLKPG